MRWVTRERPKTDRIACPWLIRRFIDPDAQILYVRADEVLDVASREGARSFDAPGAEFTHHHYAGRPWARPRSHWSMGWLPAMARVAALTPRVTNAVTSSPLAPALRWLG